MQALAPGVEDAIARPTQLTSAVVPMLLSYLNIIGSNGALEQVALRRSVVTHVHDLCALTLGACRDAAEIARGRGLRAARLQALKADIADHLADGNLSAAVLARRHRMSARYVHKLFEFEGLTVSQFVRASRLAQVHRSLTGPRRADRTIGALAYEAGFGDLSTFNHEFRRHFGMTPSDVRATSVKQEA